jgi:hypothetical protein
MIQALVFLTANCIGHCTGENDTGFSFLDC